MLEYPLARANLIRDCDLMLRNFSVTTDKTA